MTYLVLKTYPDNLCHLESNKDGHKFATLEEAETHAVGEACHRQGQYVVVEIKDVYQGEKFQDFCWEF